MVKLRIMENNPEQVTEGPPRLIPSLGAGFNTVANNVSLIILPIAVDLMLWFGPRLRIKNLVLPGMHALNAQAIELQAQVSPEMMDMVRQSQDIWDTLLENFNLFSVIRTLPVGVPSLMAFRGVFSNPLNRVGIYELPSVLAAFGSWLLIVLAGILLGTIYFNSVARSSSETCTAIFGTHAGPAVFAKHGIDDHDAPDPADHLGALVCTVVDFSIDQSHAGAGGVVRGLVHHFVADPAAFLFAARDFHEKDPRPGCGFPKHASGKMFMPNTGLMIFLIILIGQGMNVIWMLAEWDSWMALVGIAGHAFISSGLLAATFVYYRQGTDWLEERMKKQREEALQS